MLRAEGPQSARRTDYADAEAALTNLMAATDFSVRNPPPMTDDYQTQKTLARNLLKGVLVSIMVSIITTFRPTAHTRHMLTSADAMAWRVIILPLVQELFIT
jgi:hypothetical protein